MQRLLRLLVLAFSFTLIDLNRFKRTYRDNIQVNSIENELINSKERLKRKLKKHKRKSKFKRRVKYKQKRYKYAGTNSKSHRYSNQKSLRRMFRNT